MNTSRVTIGFRRLRDTLSRYRLLVLTLLVLFAVGGSSRFLRGQLVGDSGDSGDAARAIPEESLRSCSSVGTIFEGIDNLDDVREIYASSMSSIVGERENLLANPAAWACGSGSAGEPPISALKALAAKMPGWHYRVTVPVLLGSASVPLQRPVRFASFASIVAEFQREYECKLSEIRDRTLAHVALNDDIDPQAQFCCISVGDTGGCREQSDQTLCMTPLTNDPTCGEQCPVLLYVSDLTTRVPALPAAVDRERQVSRAAVEQTLHTLRSFELNYAIARQLMCYQRASLDLKNEMSLLADAVSCMPKIWDSVTSLHDRKQ